MLSYFKIPLYFFLFIFSTSLISQKIYINEIVANNGSIISDSEGDTPDWIEIYNHEDTAVNLKNYVLSDTQEDDTKWIFPPKLIPAKGFMMIFSSGKDSIFNNEEFHTNFKISSSGEKLYLFNPQGFIVDQIGKAELERNQSFGRFPDGSSDFVIMDLPTPNKGNFESNSIFPSVTSGFYSDSFLLILNNSIQSDTIYYTLNGSDPTPNDSIYIAPLLIRDRSDDPNIFSDIPTTPPDTFNRFYWFWEQPEKVAKATSLKFRSFRGEIPSSKIYHQTYFVGEKFKEYTFPIFSLMIDSSSLFDHDTGIYVPGAFSDSLGFSNWPIGNYHGEGPDWERKAHIQFFETDKSLKFSTGVGLKSHGNGSLGLAQKSLRFLFKKKHGIGKLEYPIFESNFPEDFQRLILRTGGNTFTGINFLEALLQDLVKDEDLDIQQYRPTVLFINGEYWGIHNIREKMDEDYFSSHYDFDSDQIITLFPCGSFAIGWDPIFDQVFDFIENTSFEADSNYQKIKQLIDVENVITYYIMQSFYGNKDMHSNLRWWGTKSNLTKLRTVVFDLDISFGFGWGDLSPSLDYFPYLTQEICHSLVLRKLLENQNFRNRFIERSEEMLKTTFHSDTIINRFERFKAAYQPQIQEHIYRWRHPVSFEKWEELIRNHQDFARQRPCFYKEHLENFFGIDSLNFNCNDTLTTSNTNDFYTNDEISIYPNPAKNVITLQTGNSIELKNTKLVIHNTVGQKVYQNIIDEHQQFKEIDLKSIPSGIYFLTIKDRRGVIRWKEKLVVEP